MICRISTRGFVAALLGASLAIPAYAIADTGGTPAPTPGGTGTIDPSFLLATSNSVFVGSALQIRGFVANAAGQTVNIQSQVATGGWVSVATATADGSGNFTTTWYPPTAGEYQLRAALNGAQAADTTTASTSHAVRVYKRARASWYGPGFYGKRTACGKRLNRATTGVAHRPRSVLERRILGPHFGDREEARNHRYEPRRSRPNHASTDCPSSMSKSPIRSIVPAQWPAPG
jgi:rare lipoprotein A